MDGLAATSIEVLEDLYERYRIDPASVDRSWRVAFDLAEALSSCQNGGGDGPRGGAQSTSALLAELVRQRGHLGARLDPLERGVREAEDFGQKGLETRSHVSLDELTSLYRSSLTLETAHIDDPEMRAWVCDAFETKRAPLPGEVLLRAHRKIMEATEFEAFLGRKHPTKKRFGAEGAEALFALMDRLFTVAAQSGVEEIVVGPMHRGRTSLMGVIFGTPLPELFAKFKGAHPFPADPPRPADVPYHLGGEAIFDIGERKLRVSLCPNPSHLEAVDPVVLGRVRARQDIRDSDEASRVLGLLFHSDAAVVGQGIVGESLQLSGISGFSTRGTIHVVVNNQIGFTTNPEEARSSRHCTGPFKAIDAPIIHVNGEDPEACIRAADLAVAFRQRFERDVVIDFVCYRRNGHNELDEPRFTQPHIYSMIDDRPTVRERFEQRLVEAGALSSEIAAGIAERYLRELQESYDAASEWRPNRSAYPGGRWKPFQPTGEVVPEPETGIDEGRLERLLDRLATPPADLTLHPKVERLVRQRSEARDKGAPWSLAEALAYASLVTDGVAVRLSGQDAVRGTFSSRHFGLVDTATGKRVSTISQIESGQAPFTIINSPLSEYGVLGFEYGYSLERPDALTIWEAQFGDFANGAQIIIDQFIVSGEEKWLQPSGLVMLVPHGLEGQGPEHSSARPERYLQLAACDNIQVANPSTPANYFHLLRRQSQRRVRKPLIVLAPKTLLRLPAAVSPLADFTPPNRFLPVLSSGPNAAKTILFCSGKIAYELERERAARDARDVMIVRLEMIYPLPRAELTRIIEASPDSELVLVQEEPRNMGVWSWLQPRLEDLARAAGHRRPTLRYVGRPESASPAGSFHGDHDSDQAMIVALAFGQAVADNQNRQHENENGKAGGAYGR